MMAALKPLSDNSSINIILVLVCVDYLFSLKLRFSWFLMSDFQLYLGQFCYYIMRFWIIFKSSLLSGLL